MDVIFDIDGTLADPTHRAHFIKDTAYWDTGKGIPKPNWDAFLASENLINDAPIPQVWTIMAALLAQNHRVIFITGRAEKQRRVTEEWLHNKTCSIRLLPMSILKAQIWPQTRLPIFMRRNGDRRNSAEAKEDGLRAAIAEGYDPKLVFEDRDSDTAMWRRNGLLCCQVGDGNF